MTDDEAFERAQVLGLSADTEIWVAPDRIASHGFVEQQRLFTQSRTLGS
jgi:hypothetical protein